INEKLYGKMSIPTGDIAIALAQLHENMNEWERAAELWKLAVDIGNRLEPNTVSCCRIGPRQGLARCYEQMGKFEQALTVHTELLDMCKKGATSMLPTVQGAYDQCLIKMGRQPASWTTTASPPPSR
ncbi:MAG TPA: tetratricopeptide repeat protein, partial [Chroococcales cyanobacterium]